MLDTKYFIFTTVRNWIYPDIALIQEHCVTKRFDGYLKGEFQRITN